MTNHHENRPDYLQSEAATQGGELLSSHAEAKEVSQTSEERFLELLTPPAEKLDELHNQLSEVVERTLATTINPHEQEVLLATANIIGWRLFAEPGSPLPFGLTHGKGEDGAYRITYDTNTDFGAECFRDALVKLHAAGYSEIDDSLSVIMNERVPQIEEVFADIIEASQAFQFIGALVADKPRQPTEQPLSPFWRAIREAQIGQTVKTRWGLAPEEHIVPYTEPDYDLRKELSRLDNETRLVETSFEDNPMTRLRSYLGGLVWAECAQDYPEEVFVDFIREDNGEPAIRTNRIERAPFDWIQKAARKLALQINEAGPHIHVMTEEWIYSLAEIILWPKEEPPNDFQQLHTQALEEEWNYLGSDFQQIRRFINHGDYDVSTGYRLGKLHAGLTRPNSAYRDLSRLAEDMSQDHRHDSRTRAEINIPSDKYIGEVLHFSPYARGQHSNRLIQSVPQRNNLPPLRGDEELVLRLSSEEFQHMQPYVPGYRLVSSAKDSYGDTYGFVPDPMGDPYASADILMTPQQCQAIAARYTEIGLHKLAQKLERQSRMTVQGLTSLIKARGTYITTSKAKTMQPKLPRVSNLVELADFQGVVREGSLNIQCTGASQFLRFSLEEAFGKGSASTIHGYNLSRRTISTSARHAQTVFTYQGQTYVLDATPASTEGQHYGDELFRHRHTRFRRTSFPMASLRLDQYNLERTVEKPPEKPESREQKLQTIRQSLDTQLIGLLQVTDRDAVYTKVNALPRNDPFQMTVETTLQATSGVVAKEEVERLSQYLNAYQEADEILRREMRVQSYDTPAIRVLQDTVKQLLELF